MGRNLYNWPASDPRLRKACTFLGEGSVTLALSFHVAATSICPFLPRPASGGKVPGFTGAASSPESSVL